MNPVTNISDSYKSRNQNHATLPADPATSQSDFHFHAMELFTLALSHELKNSLSKIKIAAAMAEATQTSAPLSDYIRIISTASDQMENTLGSLNELIKFKHQPAVVKAINPFHLLTEILKEFKDKTDALNSTINIELAQTTNLNYIESYFRTIISNLISNAVKYAYRNRSLHILVTEYYNEGQYVLSFRDNGAGIDLSDGSEKLFQPFSRMNFHTEGSGLGLYITKSMIERNGGRIEVESAPGVGSVFTCYLNEY